MSRERMFDRIIGVDYSGSRGPTNRLGQLAVCCADGNDPLYRVLASGDRSDNWSRKKLAHWLVDQLKEEKRTLVGIDHAFSFPIDYFAEHNLPKQNWDWFLADFRKHWPTDVDSTVDTLRKHTSKRSMNRLKGESNEHRMGDPNWFRSTDRLTSTAASVFDFDAKQREVASSTHAGLPWLLHIRQALVEARVAVKFWPFDGWKIPEGHSAVVEVYPSLWKRWFEKPSGWTSHQHDAYSVAGWLSYMDRNGLLPHYFEPELCAEHCDKAKTEGWILGVLDFRRPGLGEDVKVECRQ